MKEKVLFILICLLTSAILVACGPSQADRDAQATKIAADVFATQTAEAPIPTPTPLPPTPTPTPLPPTPTPTPLPPTPTPTPLPPTPTPTPLLDLSNVVLTLEDLPPGFEAVPSAEFGFTKEDLSQDDLTVESLFVFLEAEHFELVIGFTTLISTGLEQAGFDAALRQPDFLLESLIEGMGATDILEQKELSDLDDIGDAAGGLTVVANMEGIPMRTDFVVFRRDIVGAFVLVMYMDGDIPVVTIDDVAGKLDDRIERTEPQRVEKPQGIHVACLCGQGCGEIGNACSVYVNQKDVTSISGGSLETPEKGKILNLYLEPGIYYVGVETAINEDAIPKGMRQSAIGPYEDLLYEQHFVNDLYSEMVKVLHSEPVEGTGFHRLLPSTLLKWYEVEVENEKFTPVIAMFLPISGTLESWSEAYPKQKQFEIELSAEILSEVFSDISEMRGVSEFPPDEQRKVVDLLERGGKVFIPSLNGSTDGVVVFVTADGELATQIRIGE